MDKKETIELYFAIMEKLDKAAKESGMSATGLQYPLNFILTDMFFYKVVEIAKANDIELKADFLPPKIKTKTFGPSGEISISPDEETSMLIQLLKNAE